MDFHILDLIVYIGLSLLIWHVILPEDYTEELGTFIGIVIMFLFTIAYIILFAIYPNWNWIDLIDNMGNFFGDINFKL